MNFNLYAKEMEKRWERSTFVEKFQMLAVDFDNLVYAGGKETPLVEGDCSGTFCGPIYLMGYDIRTTADSLYKYLFIDKPTNLETREDILAVFYITKVEREHFGRMVPPGTATHIAPVVGRYVVINAFNPIDLWTTAAVYNYYSRRGFDVEWRKLNMAALEEHHRLKDLCKGVDPLLQRLRDAA